MAKKCSIGFLYLLLMIPHHGNNPIPRVDSWLQSERDDGFVDRDLTSSIAGDESFGLAHENYQNSLIRQKKSMSSALNSASRISDKRKYKNNERQEELESDNSDSEYRDENYLTGKDNAEPVFDDFESGVENPQYNRHQATYNNKYQKTKLFNSRHNNFRSNSKFMNPERNAGRYQSSNFKEDHAFMHNEDALRGCDRTSLCNKPQKNKYAPDITLGVMEVLKLEGGSKKEKHSECEKSSLRENHDLKDDSNMNDKISEGEIVKETDESAAEDDYDPEIKDSAVQEDESNSDEGEDYNQLTSHDVIYKRDDSKSEAKTSDKVAADKKNQDEKLESSKDDKSELVKNNEKSADAVQEEHEEPDFQNANLLWKMNSNLQSRELNNVMKDSQRALQEVQSFQQKMALKSNNNPADAKYEDRASVSADKENDKLKDSRDKREDEDEQKNMKTGTDEGGGEYEDEEGKGHNDQEEYYEEIDEGDNNLKRDAGKDEGKSSNSKSSDISAADEDENEDDELSLKTAPVENVQDQKRMQVEGDKKEKKDIRKGAKIWDQWSKWSPCSVTCGVGRSVRWRHCIGGGCAKGEKEAQIKKCTNPAC